MMWLALATEIAGIIHERLALANKRAEMATDPVQKKAAIDEGLTVADALHKFLDKVKGLIPELRDNPAPAKP